LAQVEQAQSDFCASHILVVSHARCAQFGLPVSATMYSKILLDDQESQRATNFCMFKSGVAFFGGSCLVLLSVIAIFAYSSVLTSSSAARSTTSLIGLQSFQTTANLLPGASPWKSLALAGIQDANRCGRDVAMNANAAKNVLAKMNNKDKAAFNVVARAAQKQVKKEILSVPNSPEELLKAGATGPLGFWDPIGFATNVPAGRLLFYREVELKHGRLCMLASLGFLVAEQFHPLFGGNIDVPSYIAFQETYLERFWYVVAAAVAVPEIFASIPTFNTPADGDVYIDQFTFTMKSNRVPGDLGFDPLGLKPADEKEFLELQNKELNNGRLAMISVAGMIAQELATGEKLFS